MSDGARMAYGTLTCTHQKGTLSKEMRKWGYFFFGPEVYEAFYDLAVGIHVNNETKFMQHIDRLFGPLAFC